MSDVPVKRNKIKVGLPLYGSVSATFFQHWLGWQGEIGRLAGKNYAGLMTTEMPYIDRAENTIVDFSLRCKCDHVFSEHMASFSGNCNSCECQKLERAEEWDYLVLIEHDNIIPEGWIARVLEYDVPIAGLIYFGKVTDDQRPIPGFLAPNGYTRLTYEQVMNWIDNPGFYEVDIIGMGATAIRRDVLEKWNPWKMPWFQTKLPPPNSIMGQDVRFCMEAKTQGHKIYVDSHFTAEHIGTWRSSLKSYLKDNQQNINLAALKARLQEKNGKAETTEPTQGMVLAPLA